MPIKAGLQLYSVREALRFDMVSTIKKVAEAGYYYLELPIHEIEEERHTFYGLSARELIEVSENYKVCFTGGYVSGIHPENQAQVMEFYQEIGSDHITIPIDYFPDLDALKRNTDFYNQLGELGKKYGLDVYYENHYHEFQIMDGEMIMDRLLANTEPDFFHLAINTYWLMRGLVDPVRTIEKYKERIKVLVQQDYPLDQIDKINMWEFSRFHPIANNIKKEHILKGGEIENIHPVMCTLYTEIGDGILKLQESLDAIGEKLAYVFLKQDYTRLPSEFASIKRSKQNYEKIRGICWK